MKLRGTPAFDFGIAELKRLFSNGTFVAAILANLATYQLTHANGWQSIGAGVLIFLIRGVQLYLTDNSKV